MAEFQLKQRTRRPSTRSKSPRKIKIINFKLEAEDSMNVRNWWLDSLSKDGMTASKGIRSNTKMHDSPLTAGMTVRYRIAWQLWLLAESQIKLFKIQLSNQEKKNDTASPGSPELKPPRMSQDACLSMFTLSSTPNKPFWKDLYFKNLKHSQFFACVIEKLFNIKYRL